MSKAKHEPRSLMKRFYAAATIASHEAGFCITLDGKNIKTPQGKLLYCASRQLAEAITVEWDVQGEYIDTDTMPLTRLLNIALDRVPLDRAVLLNDIAGYGETDLLFYRSPAAKESLIADEAAEELAALQLQHFTPILGWAETSHNLAFMSGEGIMPIAQPQTSLNALVALFESASDHELAALAMMVPLLGSALLVLAVWHGAINVDDALNAAHLDEEVQQKHWGADPHIAAKFQSKARDVKSAAFFLTAK